MSILNWLKIGNSKKNKNEQENEIKELQDKLSSWITEQEDEPSSLEEDEFGLGELSEEDIKFMELNYEEKLKEIDAEMAEDMAKGGFNFNSYQDEDLHDDLEVLDHYLVYDEKGHAEYLMFNLRVKEDHETEWTEMWKAVKLIRLIAIPRTIREQRSLMSQWDDVLIGLHNESVQFITLMANILKPNRIGLVYCYGVQACADTPEEAQKMASVGCQGLEQALMGNFSQIEYRTLTRQEADWIDKQMREMKHLLMLRGIPRPRKSAGNAATLGFGGTNADPDSEEQNEEFLRGMSETEYLLLLLTSPVGFSDIQKWLDITSSELSKYKSEVQGTKGISAGISIPMVFAGNLGAAFGKNVGESQSFGHAFGMSETDSTGMSMSTGMSESVTSSHSEGASESMAVSNGLSHTESFSESQGINYSEGVSYTEGASSSEGVSFSEGISHTEGQSYTQGFGESVTSSHSVGFSQTESSGVSHSIGVSNGTSESKGLSTSTGISESVGESSSQSSGVTNGLSESWNQGFSKGHSQSFGQSQTSSVGSSQGTSESYGESASEGHSSSVGTSHSTGTSQSQGTSHTEGNSHVIGSSQTQTSSESHGTSNSIGTSESWGENQSQSTNWSESQGFSTGTSSSTGGGTSQSHSESASESSSQSHGSSESFSQSQSQSESSGSSQSTSQSYSNSVGFSKGQTLSETQSVSVNVSTSAGGGVNFKGGIGVEAGLSANVSSGRGAGMSNGISMGESESHTLGVSQSYGVSLSQSHSNSASSSVSQSAGESFSTGQSSSQSVSNGVTQSNNWSNGTSQSVSESASHGGGVSTGSSHSNGISQSTGTSNSWGSSEANATSENFGQTVSNGTSTSIGQSESNGISQSESVTSSNGTSHSLGQTESTSTSQSQGNSQSVSETESSSESYGTGKSHSESSSISNGLSHSKGTSNSVGQSQSIGTTHSVSESTSSTQSVSVGKSESTSEGFSTSKSQSFGASVSDGSSQTQGVSKSMGSTISQGQSASKGTSMSVGKSLSSGTSVSQSQGVGKSVSDSIGVSKGETNSEGVSISNSQGKTNSQSSALAMTQGMSNTVSQGSSASMALGPSISYTKSAQWFDENKANLVLILDEQRNRLMSALRQGAFYVDIYILTPDEKSKKAAGVLSTSAWYGDVFPCPVQVVQPDPVWSEHLMAHASVFSPCSAAEDAVELMEGYKFSTILLSDELSAYCHPPRFEGGDMATVYEAIPYFRLPGRMEGEAFIGWCVSTETGKVTQIDYKFNKKNMMHTLISGSSGSGKTTTSTRFVSEVVNGMGFGSTILDWKDDWRSLQFVIPEDKFIFYSLGTTPVNRLQFNPLAIPAGVDVDLWIDSVVEAFVLGFGLGQRGYEIVWRALARLYSKTGAWKKPEKSLNLTLMDLYNEIDGEIKDKGQKKQAGFGDVEAYNRVLSRMGYFTNEDSRLYTMFGNPQNPVPVEQLCIPGKVVVLEAQGMKGPQKSFLLGLISAGIFQVARAQKTFKDTPHLIVFEEAHQVIKGTDSGGSDASSGVTEESTYEVMWNEARSAGLYMLALAQMPTHLPGSVLANTRIYITHQLGSDEDIDFISRRMIRDPRIEHKDFPRFLEKIPLGYAVIQVRNIIKHWYAEPVLVKVEMIDAPKPTDEQVRRHMVKVQGFEL